GVNVTAPLDLDRESSSGAQERAGKWARAARIAMIAAAIVPALWHIVTILRIFRSRMAYPMDIDRMEGGILLHAHRILHHQPLYGDPTGFFLPFLYPPFFHYFTALVA